MPQFTSCYLHILVGNSFWVGVGGWGGAPPDHICSISPFLFSVKVLLLVLLPTAGVMAFNVLPAVCSTTSILHLNVKIKPKMFHSVFL